MNRRARTNGSAGSLAAVCMLGTGLQAGSEVIVDRLEADRVVVEWCDRTTSDLPAVLFPPGVREGEIIVLSIVPETVAAHPRLGARSGPSADLTQSPLSSSTLKEPSSGGTEPHIASRPVRARLETRGEPRTEQSP